jgi:hypothetical protein
MALRRRYHTRLPGVSATNTSGPTGCSDDLSGTDKVTPTGTPSQTNSATVGKPVCHHDPCVAQVVGKTRRTTDSSMLNTPSTPKPARNAMPEAVSESALARAPTLGVVVGAWATGAPEL